MPNVSEFAHELGQKILGSIYEGLYEECNKLFTGIFDCLNGQIANAAQTLQQTPDVWSPSAYDTVKAIAENAFVPIAAIFVACILAWELVHLLQESNQMGGAILEKLIVLLCTCAICVFAVGHSFDIVMYFFRIGAEVSHKIAGTTVGTFGEGLSLGDMLEHTGDYTVGDVFNLVGIFILLFFGNLAVIVCSAIIYIRVVVWFLEFLIYASAASIPNATWMSKEWSQVGMNYTRKMLAVAFEGPFMLLLFAIYGGIVSGVNLGGSFQHSFIMIIGCGFALVMMMFKVGNITASIFNAH